MKSLCISICVVLYRSEACAIRFHNELVESLKNFNGWEILYYDNSPTDKLGDCILGASSGIPVIYTHDSRNRGFSYANNNLILSAKNQKILLLNPDVFGFTTALWEKINGLDVSNSARFARLMNDDGTFQDCVGDVSSVKRAVSRKSDFSRTSAETEIGMGIMAFMLTCKSVFARVGLLDCDYPLYAEDMDWCHRAAKCGVSVIYNPDVILVHIGGASSADRWSRAESIRRKLKGEIVFINKHYRGPSWLAMRMLNFIKVARTYISF